MALKIKYKEKILSKQTTKLNAQALQLDCQVQISASCVNLVSLNLLIYKMVIKVAPILTGLLSGLNELICIELRIVPDTKEVFNKQQLLSLLQIESHQKWGKICMSRAFVATVTGTMKCQEFSQPIYNMLLSKVTMEEI